MIDALVGLGSNLGDRKALVDEAVVRLARLPMSRLTARSSYYKTDPVGPVAQEWFLNVAVALGTELEPDALLAICYRIETALGRDRAIDIPSGPRLIDIDLIAFGKPGGDDGLLLRDSRFVQHGFSLVPLAEIAGNRRLGPRTIADYLAAAGRSGVERLDWAVPPA